MLEALARGPAPLCHIVGPICCSTVVEVPNRRDRLLARLTDLGLHRPNRGWRRGVDDRSVYTASPCYTC